MVGGKLIDKVLSKLGTVRNELLICDILGVLIFNWVAFNLTKAAETWVKASGVALHFTSIVVFVVFGVFYLHALRFLPSSEQERRFARRAEQDMEEFAARRQRARARAAARPVASGQGAGNAGS